MNSTTESDRVFPLDAAGLPLDAFSPPPPGGMPQPTPPPLVMGNRAFMRNLAGRRLKASLSLTPRTRVS